MDYRECHRAMLLSSSRKVWVPVPAAEVCSDHPTPAPIPFGTAESRSAKKQIKMKKTMAMMMMMKMSHRN